MTRTEALNRTLADLAASTTDIEASAVVSEDGLIIASALPQGIEEARVAAMSATMLSMGARTSIELRRGTLEQLFVKGSNGYAIVMSAGSHAMLLALTRKEAKLGLIFFELARAAESVKAILG
jgi:hypothetical protein